MIVVYCCNFAPLNVRISRTNVVSLQENIYPWANPQYETWWNHPQFRETTTKFGKIWRSLAAKWQGSPTSTDHETGHIWCFQSYIWKIQGSTCASLLAVVFNCKHQNFIACKFSNPFFWYSYVQEMSGESRAFQRLGPCLLSSWQHQDLVRKDGCLYSRLMMGYPHMVS